MGDVGSFVLEFPTSSACWLLVSPILHYGLKQFEAGSQFLKMPKVVSFVIHLCKDMVTCYFKGPVITAIKMLILVPINSLPDSPVNHIREY